MLYITNLTNHSVGIDAIVSIPANAVDVAIDETQSDFVARINRLIAKGYIKARVAEARYFVAGEALLAGDIVTMMSSAVSSTKVARTSNVATITMAGHTFVVGESIAVSGFAVTGASTKAARTDNVATIAMASCPFDEGDVVNVSGFTGDNAGLNGTNIEITAVTSTTFSYANTGTNIVEGADTNGDIEAVSNKIVSLNTASAVVTAKTDTTVSYANIGAAITEASNTDGTVVSASYPIKVYKANATNTTKPAEGFVKAAVAKSAFATVYFKGVNNAVQGLTPGQLYMLKAAGGEITTTAPSSSGNIVQVVGVALSPTELEFDVNTYNVV